jgi:hypothetical protein
MDETSRVLRDLKPGRAGPRPGFSWSWPLAPIVICSRQDRKP